ncbi:MAG: lipocalin-like domain-containing protein [Gammaproteobacteria bacterium]
MMLKRLVFGLVLLFCLAAPGIWLWRFLFPFDIEPVADSAFRKTVTQKDDSFSDLISRDDADFARALKPRNFTFPEDHGAHNAYRTEWWYFTGNLSTPEGRRFGYELTFFRFALSDKMNFSPSVWRTDQAYMAHLALTDAWEGRFYTDERFSRAGNGLAGADAHRYQVWLYDWSARAENTDFPLRLKAQSGRFGIDLVLVAQKGPVLQGNNGFSQKSAEPGNASYYYSYTRLATQGHLDIGGARHSVTGTSWMDREWSTSALSNEQSGWDWFALQLSDHSELMFYRLRRRDGRPDIHSAGSWIQADNGKVSLQWQDVDIKVLDSWKSPHSRILYPSKWQLTVPSHNLSLEITPLIPDQELNVTYRYWEGAVDVKGAKNGKAISGQGYVELTGYQ